MNKGEKIKEEKALVFNIQKCSIHDGPGIRTIIFLKGCLLRCLWCANPESQNYEPEVADTYSHCIGCHACIKECPKNCIALDREGRAVIDRARCNSCGACTKVCYAHAKRMVGEEKSAEEVIAQIMKDKRYYDNSGGGVTFSGGEPLTHPAFLLEIAKKCREEGIHTAIETCGYADYEQFAPVLPYLDFIYMDIKEMDPMRHKKLTGHGNEKIIENLKRIDRLGKKIAIRVPVIPGCNDEKGNLSEIAKLAASLESVAWVELLAYHKLGVHKYEMLGRPYGLEDTVPPSDEKMDNYAKEMDRILKPFGKRCYYKEVKNYDDKEN